MNNNINNNNNDYDILFNEKIKKYINEMPSKCYLFEITKLCGYSSLIYVYKDQKTSEIWNIITHHFGIPLEKIQELYFINSLNTNEKINLPFDENLTIRDFINNIRIKNNLITNIEPKYEVPNPVVYILYLNDGHIH